MKVKYTYTLYNKNNPYGVEKTETVDGKPCKKPTYLAGCDTGYIFIKTKSEKIHIIEIDKISEINGRKFFACCFSCKNYYSEYGFDLCRKNDETMEEPNKEKCNDYIIELD